MFTHSVNLVYILKILKNIKIYKKNQNFQKNFKVITIYKKKPKNQNIQKLKKSLKNC